MQIPEMTSALLHAFPAGAGRFAENLARIHHERKRMKLPESLELSEIFEIFWLAATALGIPARMEQHRLRLQFSKGTTLEIERDRDSQELRHCSFTCWGRLEADPPKIQEPQLEDKPALRWLKILQGAALQADRDRFAGDACARHAALPRLQEALEDLGLQNHGWRWRNP